MGKNNQKKRRQAMRTILAVIVLATVFCSGIWTGRNIFPAQGKQQTADNGTAVGSEESELLSVKDSSTSSEGGAAESVSQTGNESGEKVREMMEGMSLEEKVAQMFIITPEALTGVGTVIAAGETTREAIREYPVGGLIYFEKNLRDPEQVKEMTANIQQYAVERIGVPMFLSVDEEGGAVTRFANNENFDLEWIGNMSDIGASGSIDAAREAGNKIGSFLADLGLNMDNAPVADVLSNSANTVIGNRSFGSDSEQVKKMALAEYQGLEAQGIIGVYKHFPGHGATEADTHEGYAYTESDFEEMMSEDLIPFKYGIDNGVRVIMAAHIACPEVTGDDTPASLSYYMLTEILRNHLGYDGIIMTDGLNMGAIVNQYTSAEAAVKAIEAGVDILLMPEDFQAAYEGVLQAVRTGEISENRIDESVGRILELKIEYMDQLL